MRISFMKKTIIVLALLPVFCAGVQAAEQTVTLSIDKMYCALCPVTVKKAIQGVEGVTEANVSYETKQAVVTFDDESTDLETITLASTNAGYPATLYDDSGEIVLGSE